MISEIIVANVFRQCARRIRNTKHIVCLVMTTLNYRHTTNVSANFYFMISEKTRVVYADGKFESIGCPMAAIMST